MADAAFTYYSESRLDSLPEFNHRFLVADISFGQLRGVAPYLTVKKVFYMFIYDSRPLLKGYRKNRAHSGNPELNYVCDLVPFIMALPRADPRPFVSMLISALKKSPSEEIKDLESLFDTLRELIKEESKTKPKVPRRPPLFSPSPLPASPWFACTTCLPSSRPSNSSRSRRWSTNTPSKRSSQLQQWHWNRLCLEVPFGHSRRKEPASRQRITKVQFGVHSHLCSVPVDFPCQFFPLVLKCPLCHN